MGHKRNEFSTARVAQERGRRPPKYSFTENEPLIAFKTLLESGVTFVRLFGKEVRWTP